MEKQTFNADDAKAVKDIGMATAAAKYASILEAAKAIAIELGKVAPITVDNVTKRLNDLGYATTKKNTWKGSIFKSKNWICIGSGASTNKTSHGRHVRMWALKSWLHENKVNGMRLAASAFDLVGIYQEFRHTYNIAEGKYQWVIGKSQLSARMQETIDNDDGFLFGIPVKFVDNAVGAVLTSIKEPVSTNITSAFTRPDLGADCKSPW